MAAFGDQPGQGFDVARVGCDSDRVRGGSDGKEGAQVTAIPEAFMLIAQLARSLDAAPLTQWTGCWEHRMGDWFIAVNGHRVPMQTSTGFEVPPHHARVERDGVTIGMLDSSGGFLIGGQKIEDELIAELKRQFAKSGEPR